MSRISSDRERGETRSVNSSQSHTAVVVHVPITAITSTQETVEIAGGESSDGEGDVEIEHDEAGEEGFVGDPHANVEESPRAHRIAASYTVDYSTSGAGMVGGTASVTQVPTNIRHISKRTVISRQQKLILEEFYRCGMTSASLQVHHLHMAASEKTGLDINVVKVPVGVRVVYKLVVIEYLISQCVAVKSVSPTRPN